VTRDTPRSPSTQLRELSGGHGADVADAPESRRARVIAAIFTSGMRLARRWRTHMSQILAKPLLAIVVLVVSLAAHAAAQTVAFVDVNVVPMDRERVALRQTVIVQGHVITAMGAADGVQAPENAQIVNGNGRLWLSPGLADMHVHGTEVDDLGLYVAHGVTTVLHMGDAPSFFLSHVRPAIASGDVIGPQMFFGMKVDGAADYGLFHVSGVDQARAVVQIARTNGYDFIKVYSKVGAAEFDAIVDQARRQRMAVIGHGVVSVGLPAALFKGQVMVAHGEEFLYTAFHDEQAPDAAPGVNAVPRVAEETRRSGAFVSPTLVAYEAIARQWGRPEEVNVLLATPEASNLTPSVRGSWSRARYGARTGDIRPRLSFLRRFTKALADAGVPLLAGTDAPTIAGLVPGHSLHEELRNLVESGLSRFQALSSATRNAGSFIARTRPGVAAFGTIEAGKRADLVLTLANPLDALETLRRPVGVMVHGRWFDASTLASFVDERKRRYQSLEALRWTEPLAKRRPRSPPRTRGRVSR